jgi:hypothetical protein
MHWIAIAVVAALGVVLIRSITAGDDIPGEFSNGQFEVKGKSKQAVKKSVVQITKSVLNGTLQLLIQQADLQPVSSRFLYTLTDDNGNFSFKFKVPDDIDKIELKFSGHELWRRMNKTQ